MKGNKNFLDFILNSNFAVNKDWYEKIKQDTSKYLVVPLKVITLMVALSGIFAMIFEVRYHSEFSFEIYFVRLISTLIAFIILLLLNSPKSIKYSTIFVHILLITIITSSAIMILLIPSTLVVNSHIVGLMIFTSAMFLNWEIRNQILVAIYYNIVFAFAILFNDQKIYFLPNMFESLIFVLFLSLLSVMGSAINFRMRLQIAENSHKIELSEEKFRSIFDNSLDGIFQVAENGRIITVNRALVKIFGYENKEELLTHNIIDFYKNPEDREKLLKEVKEKQFVENYLLHLIDKNKKEIIVKVNVRLVKEEEHSFYLEGSLHDVTTEIKALEEREKAELELKAEKEKSDALAKEAMKLSTAKSRFLANMSHEIRTPMNGILGFLSLIETETYTDKDELKQFIDQAKLSSESLLETINAVLDLSKIEAGKIELENLNFNLKKIIGQAISIVTPKAKEKSLEIILDAPDFNQLNYVGDPTRIRQIFLNLLSNAIKFTKDGEIRITVKTSDIENNKVRISTAIEDSGIGIPADKISALFKPFSQVDGTENKNLGGTGLGLVICKEFTSLMGGDISVKSIEGEGSRFDFNIVVSKQGDFKTDKDDRPGDYEYTDEAKPKLSEEEIKLYHEKRKQYLILLAEDNLINQKVAIRTLNSAGYRVDAVMNGEQAVRAYKENHYDLILMDVQMPEMDGYTATRLIRELPPPKNNIPIIAITAHAMIGDREKCLEAGMNSYISKPVAAKDVIHILDKFLNIQKVEVMPESKVRVNEGPFDFQRLKQISLGDPAFEKDLLSDFLIDAEAKLQTLRELINAGDVKKIIECAHTLKGSSYSVGAKLVGDESLGIELSAKNKDLESVDERFNRLSKSIRETKEVLKDLF